MSADSMEHIQMKGQADDMATSAATRAEQAADEARQAAKEAAEHAKKAETGDKERPDEPVVPWLLISATILQIVAGAILMGIFLSNWLTKPNPSDNSTTVPLPVTESRPATFVLEAIKALFFGALTTLFAALYKWEEASQKVKSFDTKALQKMKPLDTIVTK